MPANHPRKPWTETERDLLRRKYRDLTSRQMSRLLPGRSPKAVYRQVSAMGLQKSHDVRVAKAALVQIIAGALAERATAAPYKNPAAWEELA